MAAAPADVTMAATATAPATATTVAGSGGGAPVAADGKRRKEMYTWEAPTVVMVTW